MIKKNLAVSFLLFLLLSAHSVFGMEVEDYAPIANLNGLTGYYYVDSAETLPKGEIQASLFGIAYKDDATDIKKGTAEAVLSGGILNGLETSLAVPYYRQSGNLNGLGDIKLAGKVHFLDQIEEDIPALSAAISVIFPTGDKNNGFRTVSSYGADVMLIAQAKIDLTEYSFNLTAEGGIFAQDIGQASEEKHGRYGGAGYFPLSDSWVFLLEGTGTTKYGPLNDQDFFTASASLRFFTRKVSFTGGVDRVLAIGSHALQGDSLHGSINFPF